MRQILNQKFYNLSDKKSTFYNGLVFDLGFFTARQFFERTSFAICQVFICSLKQGTFRYCLNVLYEFDFWSYSVMIGFLYPNCDQRNNTYQDSQPGPRAFIDVLR